MHSRFLPALMLALQILPSGAHADDRWNQNKGDCEQTFAQFRTESIDRLRDCAMRWEMYKDVRSVDDNQKSLLQQGLQKLYDEGTERDAMMALSALKRLGLRPERLREKTMAVPVVAPDRDAAPVIDEERVPARGKGRVEAEPPPQAEEPTRAPSRREAQAGIKKGNGHFKAGRPADALTEYLIASDADPTYAPPLYLTAMCYARLGKRDLAIDYLRQLKALNSDEARPLVRKAANEPEFKSMRAMGTFKEVTGTAVIQLLNGGGEKTKSKLLDYALKLKEAGLPVANIANDRNPRHNTYVYAKPGFDDQAEDIRRQLRLGMVHKRVIDWPSDYDIVIVLGAPSETKFIDDEAEKNAQSQKDSKGKEDEAKRKKKDAEAKEKDKMKQRLMMLKAMEQMEAPEAPEAPTDPTEIPMDAPEAPALPE